MFKDVGHRVFLKVFIETCMTMYDHVDGIAMGSPLAPILANIFMGYHKKGWIRNYNYGGLLYYKRYVDNVFAVFETKDHAVSF